MYLPPTTMIEYSGASEPMLESSVLKDQARLDKDEEITSCNRNSQRSRNSVNLYLVDVFEG